MHCCSLKAVLCNQTHFWHKWQLLHFSFFVCPLEYFLAVRQSILLPVSVFQLRGLGGPRTTGLTIKDWSKEGLKYLLVFFILCHYVFLCIQYWMEIPLTLHLFIIYFYKHFLFSFMTVVRLSSSWALALLIFSVNNFTTSLQFSWVVCPFFWRSENLFLSLHSCQNSLVSQANLLPHQLIFQHMGTACSCAYKDSFFKEAQPSLFGLFRTDCQRTVSQAPKETKVWSSEVHKTLVKPSQVQKLFCQLSWEGSSLKAAMGTNP